MGRLERKLDIDLIERIETSGPQKRNPRASKSSGYPREASTYRAVRRNAMKRAWKGAKAIYGGVGRFAITLNRSVRWPFANSYAEARQQSKGAA